MGLSVVTASLQEPIIVDELKRHLRIELSDTEQDSLLKSYIIASREVVENDTSRQLVKATYKLALHQFYTPILLPKPPLISVDEITYLDDAEQVITLSSSLYKVYTKSIVGGIRPAYGSMWPTVRVIEESINIIFTCGYGRAFDVPESLKTAILLLAADIYEHPESQTESRIVENKTYHRLIRPYIVPLHDSIRYE